MSIRKMIVFNLILEEYKPKLGQERKCMKCRKKISSPFYSRIKPSYHGPWCIECGWDLIKDDKAKLLHA